MRNVLFLVNNGKISPNENGGAAVYFSHLEILNKLGYQIHLLAISWNENDLYKLEDYTEVKNLYSTVSNYTIKTQSSSGISHLYNAICNPEKFEYHFLNEKNKTFLNTFTNEKSIDLVWAEWRWSALLACYSISHIPVIYAHHDWQYKIASKRMDRSLMEKFHIYQKKRAEFKLVKNVTACVSGSQTETSEIQQISNRKALYLPTTYTSVNKTLKKNDTPKIIHLGGMGTTANRVGLERFIDVCWNQVKLDHPNIKLQVIGSLKDAPSSLEQKLKNDVQIECLGFVEDLDSVLYPEDIHIIPWEYDTGTRTRLPVIFNYSQVLVATKASVAAFPEVQNDKNSLLCNHLEEMSNSLNCLLSDGDKRRKLSFEGKRTFENSFTLESRIDETKDFIENIFL